MMLPPMLAFFAKPIEAGLRRGAPDLLVEGQEEAPDAPLPPRRAALASARTLGRRECATSR